VLNRHVLALGLGLGACATSSPPASTPASAPAAQGAAPEAAVGAESQPSDAAPSAPAQTRALATSGADPAYLGVIDRAGLVAIIDRGLGHVLARFKLSAATTQGKFQGFRVDAIDPAWASAGIAVNDVLLRLNGQPIERTEQAMVAFESLRVASELALEVARAEQKLTLRYRIEASSPTSSASAPP